MKEPFTVMLNNSTNVPPPFNSRIPNERLPASATGLAPNESAEPLMYTTSSTCKIDLLEPGPSITAVKLGAFLMSKVIE